MNNEVVSFKNDQTINTRNYYIAYLDILGYKDFLKNHPESSEQYLHTIIDAIENTKDSIQRFKEARKKFKIRGTIELRVFSDNIVVCLPAEEKKDEIRRIILFLITVASIQTALVLNHRLIVRGGITFGDLFINEDLVFGQGLVDAVSLEEGNDYPCIAISEVFQSHLKRVCKDDTKQYNELLRIVEKKYKNLKLTENETRFLKDRFAMIVRNTLNYKTINEIIKHYENEPPFLNYLYDLSFPNLLDLRLIQLAQQRIQEQPQKWKGIVTSVRDYNFIIMAHQDVVENKVWEYCNYYGIERNNKKEIYEREKIIRKYLWLLRYHNSTCGKKYEKWLIKHSYDCDESFLRLKVDLPRSN